MTANSFNSVSLDPMLVLWSVARDANCFDDFIDAESFAIHVLADDQEAMSNRFAKSGADKFAELECTEGFSGYPFFPTTAPALNVKIENQYEGGDHIILVGRVIEFRDNGLEPLIFNRGKYAALK